MKKIQVVLKIVVLIGIVTVMNSCQNPEKTVKEIEEVPNEEKAEVKEKESARPAEWSYQGELSPAHWASLSPAYNMCGVGNSQSPINITKNAETGKQNWSFNYLTTNLHIAYNEHMHDIIDNGHTIQVTIDEGSHFKYGETEYELKQFHFHTPSEHTIDGKNLPMEVHFVHQSNDGKLAVVSALFKEGKKPNSNLASLIEYLPQSKGEENHPENIELQLGNHLPKIENAYTYLGSLTTPPCSENVRWIILSELIEASSDQMKAFSTVIGPNNRPTQAINDRKVNVIQSELGN